MGIDNSYLTKYVFKSPLDTGTLSGSATESSGLYHIDSGNKSIQYSYENTFGNNLMTDGMDTFNYSSYFGMDLETNFSNSSFNHTSFNFNFGNILNMYETYMQNLEISFMQRLNSFNRGLLLEQGAYTPSQRVDVKNNNEDYIAELQPLMQQKVRMLESYAKSKGYPFKISSGYRTREEQVALQKKYANQPGRVAGADSSLHRFGRAIDIKTNGLLTEEQCADLGRYAKSIGLRWGEDFSSCREIWHFDIPSNTTA